MALLCSLFLAADTYTQALGEFIANDNSLEPNESKIIEIVFNFCLSCPLSLITVIHDEEGEIGNTFKYMYLGIIFGRTLRWDTNTQVDVKKAQQCLFSLHTTSTHTNTHTSLD